MKGNGMNRLDRDKALGIDYIKKAALRGNTDTQEFLDKWCKGEI